MSMRVAHISMKMRVPDHVQADPTKSLPAYIEPMQLTIHIPDETAALLQSRGVELSTLIVTNEVHRGGVNTSAGEYFVTNATASTCMTHPIALN
jgi:hypothetical protein